MAAAIEAHAKGPVSGLVITRYDHAVPCQHIEIVEAAHPVPDAAGAEAAARMLTLAEGLGPDAQVLALISGGGSSLMTLLPEGIPQTQAAALNAALLASGASIDEMNCLRRHLSRIAGGRLAAAAPGSAEAVRAAGRPLIGFSGGMVEDLREIRAFLFDRMYRHWRVQRMRRKATEVVERLFAIYMATPGVLPEEWSVVCRHAVSETGRARVVADYIAGMTDRFALQEHRELTDPQARV